MNLRPSTRLLSLAAGVLLVQLLRPGCLYLQVLVLILEVLWLTSARIRQGGWKSWLRRWPLALWILLPFWLASLTLAWSQPGALAVLWLRAWVCLQWAAWTMQGMTHEQFLEGLACLRLPASMLETIALSLRYLCVMQEESQRMLRAREARSGLRRAPLLWRLRTHGAFLGNLLLRALGRGERVFLAMQARGYRGAHMGIVKRPLGWVDQSLSCTCLVAVVAGVVFALVERGP